MVLADGLTLMGEYGAGTMTEFQAFYAPTFRYSFGVGRLSLDSHVDAAGDGGGHGHGGTLEQVPPSHDLTYVRVNYLPLRWNMEAAQANLSVWGSAGEVRPETAGEVPLFWNLGGQIDYETRRIYAALRSEHYEASTFQHRIDTAQLGIAPYEHDYDRLALWFVIQARQYTGALHDGTELSALVRLFKRRAWLEAGVTQDGKAQAMLMLNF